MNYTEMSAEFSPEKDCRYSLHRKWIGRGRNKRVLIAMVNPSRGSGEKNDPTLTKITNLLDALNYNQFHVVNWSPFISPTPGPMFEFMQSQTGRRNIALHDNLITVRGLARDADLVIAGWGNNLPKFIWNDYRLSKYTDDFYSLLSSYHTVHCFGETNSGAPKHPLARGKALIRIGSKLTPWRGSIRGNGL